MVVESRGWLKSLLREKAEGTKPTVTGTNVCGVLSVWFGQLSSNVNSRIVTTLVVKNSG